MDSNTTQAPVWQTCSDNNGRTYYYNTVTKQTSWTPPSDGDANLAPTSDWVECLDKATQKVYYYNNRTKQTSWTKPGQPQSDGVWVECVDKSTGKTYYYNNATRETSWVDPHQRDVQDEESKCDGDWVEVVDESTNRKFFYDKKRRVSRWKLPSNPIELEHVPTAPRERRMSTGSVSSISSRDDVPAGWEVFTDPKTQRKYFYNRARKVSSWTRPDPDDDVPSPYQSPDTSCEKPHQPPRANSSTSAEGEEWVESRDPSTGKLFLYNKRTRKSVWKPPEHQGSVNDPGQHHTRLSDGDASRLEDANPNNNNQHTGSPNNTVDLGNPTDDWQVFEDPATKRQYYYSAKRKQSVWKTGDSLPHKNVTARRRSLSISSTTSSRHSCDFSDEDASWKSSARFEETGCFQDYLYKQGGGTRFFGRHNWKKRFFVLVDGKLAGFKSKSDFDAGHAPIKNRWTCLRDYRLEEMICDDLGFRLLPAEKMTTEQRVWNLRAANLNQKHEWIRVLHGVVGGPGFVKSLDKALSSLKLLRPDLAA